MIIIFLEAINIIIISGQQQITVAISLDIVRQMMSTNWYFEMVWNELEIDIFLELNLIGKWVSLLVLKFVIDQSKVQLGSLGYELEQLWSNWIRIRNWRMVKMTKMISLVGFIDHDGEVARWSNDQGLEHFLGFLLVFCWIYRCSAQQIDRQFMEW